jgi:anti-anti-sigma factor
VRFHVVERGDDITQVALEGRLDVVGMHAVDVGFHQATAGMERPAIVDLSGLEYIASIGVGLLFSSAKSLDRRGHRMVLVGPPAGVKDILLKVGMERVVPIVSSVKEAETLLAS